MTRHLPPILSKDGEQPRTDDDLDYLSIVCDMYLNTCTERTTAQRVMARINYTVDFNKDQYTHNVY